MTFMCRWHREGKCGGGSKNPEGDGRHADQWGSGCRAYLFLAWVEHSGVLDL